MSMSKWDAFVCPIDQESIQLNGNALKCAKGHSFDLAREGYCNLLLVQQKASMHPGDSAEMVAARRRFLEAGFYAPIAEKLSSMVTTFHQEPDFKILDAGCGEGYYLRSLGERHPQAELLGIDISKDAVKAAAKKNSSTAWAVASNKQLPLKSESVDLILCMFGFPVWGSFAKVQKSGGCILMVDPAEEHLIELRELIYPEVSRSAPPSITSASDHGYRLVREESLRFSIELLGAQPIQDLLAMTPHGYRISEVGLQKIKGVNHLKLTADVSLRILQR